MMPVFADEFVKCQVEPTDQCPRPAFPKMVGNKLTNLSNGDWKFEGIVRFPSGRPRYWSLLLPPGQEGITMETLHSKEFWHDLWETLIIDMHGSGEGLGK